MEKPICLLDVDGVVNAVVPKNDFPMDWPENTWRLKYVEANGYAWPIHYSTKVVDALNKLARRVEIRWHTTWQDDALKLGKALGLNPYSVQEAPQYRRTLIRGVDAYNWWKMYAPVNVLNVEKRPLIWIDDDLSAEWRFELGYASDEEAKYCTIQPYTSVGLVQRHFDEIEKFLSDLGA